MAREPYYKEFIPKSSMLPKTVLEYRTPETLQLPPKQLGELCQVFQLEELIMSQVQAVERATRSQSASRIWFRQRAGRITASKLKQAIKTNPRQPSKSLIKAICYPEAYRFTTAATRYLGFELREGRGKAACKQCLCPEKETLTTEGIIWIKKKAVY